MSRNRRSCASAASFTPADADRSGGNADDQVKAILAFVTDAFENDRSDRECGRRSRCGIREISASALTTTAMTVSDPLSHSATCSQSGVSKAYAGVQALDRVVRVAARGGTRVGGENAPEVDTDQNHCGAVTPVSRTLTLEGRRVASSPRLAKISESSRSSAAGPVSRIYGCRKHCAGNGRHLVGTRVD